MKQMITTVILLCSTANMVVAMNKNDKATLLNIVDSLKALQKKAQEGDAQSTTDLDHFRQNLADTSYIIPCFAAGRLSDLGLLDSNNKVPRIFRQTNEAVLLKATMNLNSLGAKARKGDAESITDLGHFRQNLADPSYIIPCFAAGRLSDLGLLDSNNKVHKILRQALAE